MFGYSEDEKQKSINQILRLLNLYKVWSSYIGGKRKKSIYGGHRKRETIEI